MVPDGWRLSPISTDVEILHGFAFQSQFFAEDGPYSLLTPGNFNEEGGFRSLGEKQKFYNGPVPDRFVLKAGDLLVAMTEQKEGLLGSPVFVPDEGVWLHNQRLGRVRLLGDGSLDLGFLFYVLNQPSVRREIFASAGGTKVKHTSPQKIGAVVAALPPIGEQSKIATILSTWDRAIERLEKLIANSKAQKKSLMQRLLTGGTRFEEFVVSADVQKTKYVEIPADWGFVPIASVATELSQRNDSGANYPVLSCSKHQGFVDSLSYFKKQVFSNDTSNYKVVPRGCFGYPSNHIEEGSIGHQDICQVGIVSPIYTVFDTGSALDDGYLYKLLKTEHYRQIFSAATNASVDRRGSLRWKEFSKIRIPLPSLDEQKRISDAIDQALRITRNLQTRLKTLRSEKKALMQQLLTGKRRVRVDDQPAKEIAMPKRDTHRVMPHPEGGWQVKRDGDQRATHRTDTKAEAETLGRDISRNQQTEFQVHRKDGTIQKSDSHGNDPFPPKG